MTVAYLGLTAPKGKLLAPSAPVPPKIFTIDQPEITIDQNNNMPIAQENTLSIDKNTQIEIDK